MPLRICNYNNKQVSSFGAKMLVDRACTEQYPHDYRKKLVFIVFSSLESLTSIPPNRRGGHVSLPLLRVICLQHVGDFCVFSKGFSSVSKTLRNPNGRLGENHHKHFPICYVYSTKTVKTYQGEGLTIECDKKQVENDNYQNQLINSSPPRVTM